MKSLELANLETADLCRKLALLMHSGLAAGDALHLLAEEESDGQLQRMLTQMTGLVDEGAYLSQAFEEAGCILRETDDTLFLRAPARLQPVRHIRTMPYPGFPTDAQAVVMVMAALGSGTSIFVENIFESRYKHVGELNRLGAKIKVEGKVAIIEGVPQLSGAPVYARELRGGAALVVAGLAASGETQVLDPVYIDRGYERFERNLRSVGAQIRRAGPKCTDVC